MLSPETFVNNAAECGDFWIVFWTACAGVGTALAALLTATGLLYTWRKDAETLQREGNAKLDRAAYMAIPMHHEMHIIRGLMRMIVKEINIHIDSDPRLAFMSALGAFESIQIPSIEMFAGRLDPFKALDAARVVTVASRVWQSNRKVKPDPAYIGTMPLPDAAKSAKILARSAFQMFRAASAGMRALEPYMRRAGIKTTDRRDRYVAAVASHGR